MDKAILNPWQHDLNGSGTACEDGTSKAGAVPCPACQWAADNVCALCGRVTNPMYMCDASMESYCIYCWPTTPCGEGKHLEDCPTVVFNG